jgi:sigma-B regulation protein RsbU (phosphoserine phosphatase)
MEPEEETNVIQRIRRSTSEKHENLAGWLGTAPEPEKECCLACEDDLPVQEHLQVLDEVMEKADNQTLGICEVCHGKIEENVMEIDYTASICLDCLSDEQRRQLESELEFSSEIQRALLPQQDPAIPGLEIAAFSRPAQIIGGDYFDFFQFHNGAHGLVIADVMGHGVSASLLMSSLQTALHTLIPDADSTAEVMQRVNRYYLHNVNLTTFVTVFLGQFDSAKQVLTYCNAGHNPPLLYRKNPDGQGQTSWLQPTGAAIGVIEDYTIRAEQVSLQDGDVLLLYTDGLTEAINSGQEQLGKDRLVELVAKNSDLPVRDLVSAIRRELADFIGGEALADDVTILVCKVPG